jgi:hypothetical protein
VRPDDGEARATALPILAASAIATVRACRFCSGRTHRHRHLPTDDDPHEESFEVDRSSTVGDSEPVALDAAVAESSVPVAGEPCNGSLDELLTPNHIEEGVDVRSSR